MLDTLKTRALTLVRDEEGATLIEYVLLVALIAIVAIIAMTFLGNKASNTLNTAGGKLT